MIWNLIAGLWVTGVIYGAFQVPEAQFLKKTPIVFFHVPMAISMLACFLAAAIYGALWLGFKKPQFDALSLAWGEVGFVAGCVTFATGLLFARANWNGYWTGDPQQVGVLGTLMLYAALLTLRGAVDDENKKRNAWAVYSIFGVIAAGFGCYVYSRIVPAGASLHPNNTIKSSTDYRMVFTFSIFGYLFMITRIVLLRARLERATSRLRELTWSF
jgi:hypothetical protein